MFNKVSKPKITIRRLVAFGFLLVLALLAVALYVGSQEVRRVTDDGFIILDDKMAPDYRHRLLIYHYDIGATGYGRAFWAVTPVDYSNINLADYELPDRYMAEGWSEDGELLIKKWDPYYYPDEYVELKTGDKLYGVHIRLIDEEAKQNPVTKRQVE